MRRIEYPEPLQRLVIQLKRLPGIGPRSAERIALWLVGGQARPDTGNRGREVAETILENAAKVRQCVDCGFFTTEERCEICRDEARADGPLCVVEQATDILPLERTGVFPRALPRARRTAGPARPHRTRGPDHRPAAGARPRRPRAGDHPGPRRGRGRRSHRAISRQPAQGLPGSDRHADRPGVAGRRRPGIGGRIDTLARDDGAGSAGEIGDGARALARRAGGYN